MTPVQAQQLIDLVMLAVIVQIAFSVMVCFALGRLCGRQGGV